MPKCLLCNEQNTKLVRHHWNGYDNPNDLWRICYRCNTLLKGKHDGSLTIEQAKEFTASFPVNEYKDINWASNTDYYARLGAERAEYIHLEKQ